MKTTVAEYIADYLVSAGIQQVFSVVGGGAMYLNDALGHHSGLTVMYNHHEQASAIAAESYARVTNRIAAVCVTSGPGGTNALTGVLCGYMGSIPMLILSGQVRYPLTPRGVGIDLRTVGYQEFDISKLASGTTKYCEMVVDPASIRYHLEKALCLANIGRPGPVWLDIPLDVQNSIIDPETLDGFSPAELTKDMPPQVSDQVASNILKRLSGSERPVLFAGLGVRLSGAYQSFLDLVALLKIPVVTGMSSADLLPNDHPYYAGRAGVTGDRAGNLAVQNSDFLLSIGSRLSMINTGYETDLWARNAYKVVCDIDRNELRRSYLRIDKPVWADAMDFISALMRNIQDPPLTIGSESWVANCRQWVDEYPVVSNKHYVTNDGKANIYAFYRELSKHLEPNAVVTATSGMSRVVARQAMEFKQGQRLIVNHTTSPMGYCLPASIGACVANQYEPVTLVTGEGGFQMNIQELQTIIHHKLPIRIFVINNEGYHSIRQTQNAYFRDKARIGIGPESGDLSFPALEHIAKAYGFPYHSCDSNENLSETIRTVLTEQGPVICEVFVTTEQSTEPKASSRRLPDGRMVSAPLEDMAPFLPREELKENMYIPLVEE